MLYLDSVKRLTDKDFIYVSADKTNVRETFERIRREREADKERERLNIQERLRKTIQIRRGER